MTLQQLIDQLRTNLNNKTDKLWSITLQDVQKDNDPEPWYNILVEYKYSADGKPTLFTLGQRPERDLIPAMFHAMEEFLLVHVGNTVSA